MKNIHILNCGSRDNGQCLLIFIIYRVITHFAHANHYKVKISDRKEEEILTMDTQQSLYNCLQHLLGERIQFKALFYGADQEMGSLTWK